MSAPASIDPGCWPTAARRLAAVPTVDAIGGQLAGELEERKPLAHRREILFPQGRVGRTPSCVRAGDQAQRSYPATSRGRRPPPILVGRRPSRSWRDGDPDARRARTCLFSHRAQWPAELWRMSASALLASIERSAFFFFFLFLDSDQHRARLSRRSGHHAAGRPASARESRAWPSSLLPAAGPAARTLNWYRSASRPHASG